MSFDSPIVITGASGFIGSEVVARLLKRVPPERIVLLGRRVPEPGKSLFALRLAEHGLTHLWDKLRWAKADLVDAKALSASLEQLGPQVRGAVVVHLAAIIHRTGDAAEQERMNVGVTRDLLAWAASIGGRFLFMSSVVSFGGADTAEIRSEKDFPSATGPGHDFDYYETKHRAHSLVLREARVPSVLFCPGIVHGRLENFKNSRGHLRALRDGRLKVAPPGGGNIVGLDRVAQAVADEALRTDAASALGEPLARTRLLVDLNISYRDYFQEYVNFALGAQAPRIRALPAWTGKATLALHRALRRSGRRVSTVEGLAQASLWLYFKSDFAQPPTEGALESLKASLDWAE